MDENENSEAEPTNEMPVSITTRKKKKKLKLIINQSGSSSQRRSPKITKNGDSPF